MTSDRLNNLCDKGMERLSQYASLLHAFSPYLTDKFHELRKVKTQINITEASQVAGVSREVFERDYMQYLRVDNNGRKTINIFELAVVLINYGYLTTGKPFDHRAIAQWDFVHTQFLKEQHKIQSGLLY